MRKVLFQLSTLVALLAAQLLLSCRTSGVLSGHVPYKEYVDSVSKISKTPAQIPNKKQYIATGGVTHNELRAIMMLGRAIDRMTSDDNRKKQYKEAMSNWMDHPIDMGVYIAEYQMTDNETVKIHTRLNNAREVSSAVFHVDSAFVEKGSKKIPIAVHAVRFTIVRNPPLDYIFTCNFKYKRKWYSLYHHVDIEKDTAYKGHETICERLR